MMTKATTTTTITKTTSLALSMLMKINFRYYYFYEMQNGRNTEIRWKKNMLEEELAQNDGTKALGEGKK